jgi:hypothetical protein
MFGGDKASKETEVWPYIPSELFEKVVRTEY